MAYLEAQGLASDPWRHQILYDLFARHYSTQEEPRDDPGRRRLLARDLFRLLGVQAPPQAADHHAEALWEVLGPTSLEVFPEVIEALDALERAGLPCAVVSNWQHGLGAFCDALGLGRWFRHVLASAEVGSAKPDAGIFLEAARRLGVPPGQILHVGDTWVDDVEGASGAGFATVHLTRGGPGVEAGVPAVESLARVPAVIGLG